MKTKQWIIELTTYLLALLFLFTALSKIFDLRHFIRQMYNQVFPYAIASMLIILVPLSELIAFALLVRRKTQRLGLIISLFLMTSFSIYVGLVTLNVFPKVPCSCAGVFNRMSWNQHLVFNLAFTLIAAAALYLCNKNEREALFKASL